MIPRSALTKERNGHKLQEAAFAPDEKRTSPDELRTLGKWVNLANYSEEACFYKLPVGALAIGLAIGSIKAELGVNVDLEYAGCVRLTDEEDPEPYENVRRVPASELKDARMAVEVLYQVQKFSPHYSVRLDEDGDLEIKYSHKSGPFLRLNLESLPIWKSRGPTDVDREIFAKFLDRE